MLKGGGKTPRANAVPCLEGESYKHLPEASSPGDDKLFGQKVNTFDFVSHV